MGSEGKAEPSLGEGQNGRGQEAAQSRKGKEHSRKVGSRGKRQERLSPLLIATQVELVERDWMQARWEWVPTSQCLAVHHLFCTTCMIFIVPDKYLYKRLYLSIVMCL